MSESQRINPFERGGDDYARHRPDYPSELVDTLARHCRSCRRVLDAGCGSGQFSRRLVERFEHCIAIDPSATQIRAAAAHPRIDYLQAASEAIPLVDQSVDLIVAAQAAHWFDLPRFYREARRIARPGAPLALVSYAVPVLAGAVGAAFTRFYEGPIHDFWPPARRHVESGYRTLDFPFDEREVERVDIRRDWTWPDMAGYISTWSATKAACDAGAEAVLRDAVAGFERAWGDPDTVHRVSWLVTVRLAVP